MAKTLCLEGISSSYFSSQVIAEKQVETIFLNSRTVVGNYAPSISRWRVPVDFRMAIGTLGWLEKALRFCSNCLNRRF